MPLPRLARHLRPCLPREAAHTVRCASWTRRTSTANESKAEGTSTSPSPSPSAPAQQQTDANAKGSDGPAPAPRPPPEKGSWWSVVLRRLASVGAGHSHTASPEEQRHAEKWPQTPDKHSLPPNDNQKLSQERSPPTIEEALGPSPTPISAARHIARPRSMEKPTDQSTAEEVPSMSATSLPSADASQHVAHPPSSSFHPRLESDLTAMQSKLLQLQEELRTLNATMELASAVLTTKQSQPLTTKQSEPLTTKQSEPLTTKQSKPLTSKQSEPRATKSASRETPVGKHGYPVVLSKAQKSLIKAWNTYWGDSPEVKNKVHNCGLFSLNARVDERSVNSPSRASLNAFWETYLEYRANEGNLATLARPFIRSLSRPKRAAQGTSGTARPKYDSGQETANADPMVHDVVQTMTHGQTQHFESNYDAPTAGSGNNEMGEQSLLEELFPEATELPPSSSPVEKNPDQFPKLELPDARQSTRLNAPKHVLSRGARLQQKQAQVMESFKKNMHMENISILQLSHCSTELTEVDFVRLIPQGKHIENWRRGGEFFKIIPGRDPLSLERMPFYYLLFNSPEASLAYQKNAARLHKLNALHQPTNILSAVPAPKGFLEDGEDVSHATSSYNLVPPQQGLHLTSIMQPYNPELRALVERGGYYPIVPNIDERGQRIWKVLMYIEGYEPSPAELFRIFTGEAWSRGMQLSLYTESASSINRLRDIVNLKTSTKSVSSIRPRAYGTPDNPRSEAQTTFDDPTIQSLMGVEGQDGIKELNQYVMNRVYNRWLIDFDDEVAARRFAINWHRRVLPGKSDSKGTWGMTEVVNMCNAEVLW
ncbi:hypothetical protein J1614_006371 [Plenodomus biglobosus]|nr:hypothetical protein J1614_006371 [Plenodomus biglobosus]